MTADIPRTVVSSNLPDWITMKKENIFFNLLVSFLYKSTRPALPWDRSFTPFHYFNTERQQGPHQIPFVYWNVFWYLINQAGISPDRLLGTRIIPHPWVALRIIWRMAQEPISSKAIKKEDFYKKLKLYMMQYMRLYRQKEYRKLIELNPSQTGHLWSVVTPEDRQGKGERSKRVAEHQLGKKNAIRFDMDLTNTHNQYKAGKRLAQADNMIESGFSQRSYSEDSDAEDELPKETIDVVRDIDTSLSWQPGKLSGAGLQKDGDYGQPGFAGPDFGGEEQAPEEDTAVPFEVMDSGSPQSDGFSEKGGEYGQPRSKGWYFGQDDLIERLLELEDNEENRRKLRESMEELLEYDGVEL